MQAAKPTRARFAADMVVMKSLQQIHGVNPGPGRSAEYGEEMLQPFSIGQKVCFTGNTADRYRHLHQTRIKSSPADCAYLPSILHNTRWAIRSSTG